VDSYCLTATQRHPKGSTVLEWSRNIHTVELLLTVDFWVTFVAFPSFQYQVNIIHHYRTLRWLPPLLVPFLLIPGSILLLQRLLLFIPKMNVKGHQSNIGKWVATPPSCLAMRPIQRRAACGNGMTPIHQGNSPVRKCLIVGPQAREYRNSTASWGIAQFPGMDIVMVIGQNARPIRVGLLHLLTPMVP